jgi:hypothetical protein
MRSVRREFPVSHALQFTQKRELREVRIIDPTHFKNAVRANLQAIPFSFTLVSIDDRLILARHRSALLARPVRVLRGPLGLLFVKVR